MNARQIIYEIELKMSCTFCKLAAYTVNARNATHFDFDFDYLCNVFSKKQSKEWQPASQSHHDPSF